jgi:mRNA interferase RelE/StbE
MFIMPLPLTYYITILTESVKIYGSSVDTEIFKRFNSLTKPDFAPSPLEKKSCRTIYKLKIGDWRAIYEINHDSKVVTVHKVGHRREIYKGSSV